MLQQASKKHRKGKRQSPVFDEKLKPCSVQEASSKVFAIPELLLKIYLATSFLNTGFVWLGMASKSMYAAVWNNADLMRHLTMSWDPRQHGMMHSLRGALPNFDLEPLMVDSRFIRLIGLPTVHPALQASFSRFARRALHMVHMNWCGMCGVQCDTAPFWNIGTRVCAECRHANFMSKERLRDIYGLTFTTWICGKMLIDHLAKQVHVAYIRRCTRDEFVFFTKHADDIKAFVPSTFVAFVWIPQLAKVLNLEGLKALQEAKKAAATVMVPMFKRLKVLLTVMLAQRLPKKMKHPLRFFTMGSHRKQVFMRNFREAEVLVFVAVQ
jgi:hypothetical protein